MSETETQTETTEAPATPGVVEFKLGKAKKEVAEQFHAGTISYRVPVAVEGNLDATLESLRGFVAPEADFGTVLVSMFNGSGYNLFVQKKIKDALGPDVEGASLEAVQATVDGVLRVGAPRAKGAPREGGKVAKAEAKATAALNTAAQMYGALSPDQRPLFRDQILALGGVTEEQLDEAASAADAEGGLATGGNRGNQTRRGR